jgi:uncharacterized membrane protein
MITPEGQAPMLGLSILWYLFAFCGWMLGIVAFFKVLAVEGDVARLRRSIREAQVDRLPTESAPADLTEPVQPEPEIAVAPAMTMAEPVAEPRDIEGEITTRWGVWLGSVALVLAGVFLVRYAVDQGLLGPLPRCIFAGLLGVALIAAAEWLHRHDVPLARLDDYAAPGLAAAGVAVLFGAGYGASVLYGLVSPLTGFVLLASASLIGVALSLRHGQLVAAVGLVGAFVAPALVQTEHPSLPGLFAYLSFVTATALGVVRYTAWIWLGWASTIAGAVWVMLAVIEGPGIEAWAPALFVPIAAAINLGLLPAAALDHAVGKRLAWVPCAALGVAGLLLACLYQGWDTRIPLLLLVPITIWQAAREERLRLLPFLAGTLFLLLLSAWSIRITDWPDIVVPPGEWTPSVVQELLATAAFVSGIFAASGLWFERRSDRGLSWSTLAATVPVLTLAVCYWRVADFKPSWGWATFALLLAIGLICAAGAALRERPADGKFRAGVHAAGAVAALALGCAMLLREHWLTLAISLFLPGLAWIEAQVRLPALRRIAAVVAGVVAIRLLLNQYVFDYGIGEWPVVNNLLAAYGVPAAAFALAAAQFRRAADDVTVGVLEAGSVAFVTVLAALEIRQGFHVFGGLPGPSLMFAEAALQLTSLAVLAFATLRIAERLNRPVLMWCWYVQGLLASVIGIVLVGLNPAVSDLEVGSLKLLDWLLPAYLLPALIAAAATREPAIRRLPELRIALAGYALLAGFVWLTLEVRHLFNAGPIGLRSAPVQDAELWAWSGAWLAYGVVVMAIGIAAADRRVRLAALAVVGLTSAKVFIFDMSGLVGLWRVLSFLGLGLVLIGLGAVYRRLNVPMVQRGT